MSTETTKYDKPVMLLGSEKKDRQEIAGRHPDFPIDAYNDLMREDCNELDRLQFLIVAAAKRLVLATCFLKDRGGELDAVDKHDDLGIQALDQMVTEAQMIVDTAFHLTYVINYQ